MKPSRRTGIVNDPRFAGHCMGPDQPECQQRLDILCAMLDEPDLRNVFQKIMPRRAAKKELLRVHSQKYIDRLEETEGKDNIYLDPDTCTSPLSHETALLAAGGFCRAVEMVHTGMLDNAFALIRPPGHHAERAAAKGFCLYNNIAVGARHARHELGLDRVLIVDWDLHHGNGTQHCFEEDPSVLFFSVHRSFFYPGSGRLREVGRGAGKGFTINIPLVPGFGDGEYLVLFENIMRPVALEFKPEIILVSAGFDIHHNDPMGGMQITPKGFAAMTRSVLDMADDCCDGKVVMALEGGYDLEALRDSVREVLKEMAGLQHTDKHETMSQADLKKIEYTLWRTRRVHKKHWKCLATPVNGTEQRAPSVLVRIRESLIRLAAYLKS
jgi:acetoin utilization deacetylase AcuC-like enzyme